MYKHYKLARNMSWRALLDCKIECLPIDLGIIVKHYGVNVIPYSQSMRNAAAISEDGYACIIDGTKTIFLNDKIKTVGRRRFTVGHELGHILLGHDLNNIARQNSECDRGNIIEIQANVFSRDILMPACVLNAIDMLEPAQIAKVCNVSMASATIRSERLAVLRERNTFGYSQLERMVLKQFNEYIEKNKH